MERGRETSFQIGKLKKGSNPSQCCRCDSYWRVISVISGNVIYSSLQIANTKTNDNQQTLMHFLATMAEKHYPDVMDFADELLHVEKATRGMMHSFGL